MIRDLLRHFVLKEKASSQDFINFWKKQGARIGEGTYFFDPESNCLGINNPCNLTIGRNVQVTHGVVIVDHGYDWSVLKEHTARSSAILVRFPLVTMSLSA